VWDESDVEGLLSAFPYLKQFGISDKRLIYKLDFSGVRFIFLWTGKYDYRSPSSWDATQPAYDARMIELKKWLDEAKTAGTRTGSRNVRLHVRPLDARVIHVMKRGRPPVLRPQLRRNFDVATAFGRPFCYPFC
jgi:hypothetical protein